MGIHKLVIAILNCLNVRYTNSFVKKLCIGNIQGSNLFGITRMLEVFGVKSRAIRLESVEDLREVDLPCICKTKGESFTVVTKMDEKKVFYTYGSLEENDDWESFSKKIELIAVMLHAGSVSGEPKYEEHRKQELRNRLYWLIPAAYVIWLVVMQFITGNSTSSPLPSLAYRLSGALLAAFGLFLSILLHRQWTGDGNAVERVCSLFKTSSCSSSHDTFFFNKWFDLSEVGISYFLSIILTVLVTPQKSLSAAWVLLPALPASLWNLSYQFFKQKHWCPICVTIQILFWIIALAFLLCGAYGTAGSFKVSDIAEAMLLWGTLLVIMTKAVTPAIRQRHEAEMAQNSLSRIKGMKEVSTAILGEWQESGHKLEIAVSPTCPYCKEELETIETILQPTGRFVINKIYKSIHEGDDEKIEKIIGKEQFEKDKAWCDEHQINATPTIFVDGKKLGNPYSIADLLYL